MKNKTILVIAGFLLIGILTAQITISEWKPVVYEKPIQKVDITKSLTFECDKTLMYTEINEPDGKFDDNDIESGLRRNCPSGNISKITDADGKIYSENDGVKEFIDANDGK